MFLEKSHSVARQVLRLGTKEGLHNGQGPAAVSAEGAASPEGAGSLSLKWPPALLPENHPDSLLSYT